MKKNDWLLIIGVVIAAVFLFFFLQIRGKDSSGQVIIKVEGREEASYALGQDQTIEIGTTNVLEIKDGKASMIHADCPDQLCVKQRSISKQGESIICLPNRIIVEVEGADEAEIDAVTN